MSEMLLTDTFTQHCIYCRCFVSFAEETDASRLQTMYQKARQDANWVLQKVGLARCLAHLSLLQKQIRASRRG